MCGVDFAPRYPVHASSTIASSTGNPSLLLQLGGIARHQANAVAHPLNYMAASRDRRRGAPIASAQRFARDGTRAGRMHMNLFSRRIRSFVREESGQDLIEYAMLVALIALGCVVAVTGAGNKVKDVFNAIVAAIPVAGA
jgi:pilus assembly protein Flp/PilA